ncbi:MAG: hypothetical protein KDD37_04435 [Bdellovibrionales bacterium]|nr:hypothetical protein [Bdellovibrionales bacterium]
MKSLLLLLVISFLSQNVHASDDKTKEFFTSVMYGTLAGALVGAASLAFVDNPGDDLQRVAKGASLGLYAGIALGIYVTQYYDNGPPEPELGTEPEVRLPTFFVAPIVSNNSIDGFTSQLTVYNF